MTKIAIDIVLLPPEEIMDLAVAKSESLNDDNVKLNKEKCLPHISLCMGVLKEEDFSKAKEIIEEVAKNFSPLNLEITGIDVQEGYSGFHIKKIDQLQKLHQEITNKIKSFLSYDATKDEIYPSQNLNEKKAQSWINGYLKKSSFENVYPHITLSTKEAKQKEINVPFTASRLAICHLGNYCTCRKILFETELK